MEILKTYRMTGEFFARCIGKVKDIFVIKPDYNLTPRLTEDEVIKKIEPGKLLSNDYRYIHGLCLNVLKHRDQLRYLKYIKECGGVRRNDRVLSECDFSLLVIHLRALDFDQDHYTCNQYGDDLLYIGQLIF